MIDNGAPVPFAPTIALAEDGDCVAVAENAVAHCCGDDGIVEGRAPARPRHGFRPASERRFHIAGRRVGRRDNELGSTRQSSLSSAGPPMWPFARVVHSPARENIAFSRARSSPGRRLGSDASSRLYGQGAEELARRWH